MRRRIAALMLLIVATCSIAGRASAADPERILLDLPSAQRALDDAAVLDRVVHRPGDWGDRFITEWIANDLRADGFVVRVESFEAQVFHPKLLSLELLVRPAPVALDLRDHSVAGDGEGARPEVGLPFVAGSGNAIVTAPVVYADRGRPADYAELQRNGVEVSGRIVLVRATGGSFGTAAREAQARGAAGILFYPDPADGGSAAGPAYPDGPFRPSGVAIRGTTGYPYLQIPILTIDADDAARILALMRGIPAPPEWHGGIPDVPYVLGMTADPVRMTVRLTVAWETLWNVTATLPGRDPRHAVILAAHHDAWAYGVTDGGTGIVTLLEAARSLGYLYQAGWRPRRSIVALVFDGETLGDAGSETYAREHRTTLENDAVAYIDADTLASGSAFATGASPALSSAMVDALRTVPDPQRPTAVLFDRSSAVPPRLPETRGDAAPFAYDLGIPVACAGFYGPFGVRDTGYDDLHFATTFGDPGFADRRALAQLDALLAMRLADGPVLPYRFTPYAAALRAALVSLERSDPAAAPLLAPIAVAVARFAPIAARFDAHPTPSHDDRALAAVRLLDRTLYGMRDGVPTRLPEIAASLARPDLADRVRTVVARIDAARLLLQ